MGKAAEPKYRRILVKLSGEALQGHNINVGNGIDGSKLAWICQEIGAVTRIGVQVALVIGGGNLIRGADLGRSGVDRIAADQMGMLSTIINGLALRDAFNKQGIPAVLLSALDIPGVVDPYSFSLAREHLSAGRVVILAGGTGNPLVTTDSAAAIRGIEVQAEVVLKATKVDHVYSQDPHKNPDAKPFTHLSYAEVLKHELGVMDLNAILLCRDHGLSIRVFNMSKQDGLMRIMLGEEVGTLIDNAL